MKPSVLAPPGQMAAIRHSLVIGLSCRDQFSVLPFPSAVTAGY
ncbi:MAG: hypothetical protein NZ959_07305 [Armatimonadetes bacterium]|nr:hypothetical protein [Armatimonadota bacterium]MDW8122294.1 hypothetical protein [Armatimonadota bacterium]